MNCPGRFNPPLLHVVGADFNPALNRSLKERDYNNAFSMKYRMLGKTEICVSEIGFGGWAIGGADDLFGMPIGWSNVDDSSSRAAISRALDLGINFFDTADVYGDGHSEQLLGECLAGKQCVIATKVGNRRTETTAVKDFSAGHIHSSIESSLRRLKREIIDVYQFHNPPREILATDEPFRTLDSLKQEGKIRARGVSVAHPADGVKLIRDKKVDALQVLFNILNQEPARELFPLAEHEGVGIIVRVPLASGLLTGKFRQDQQFPPDDNRRNYLSAKRLKAVLSRVERLKVMVESSGQSLPQIALAFVLRFAGVTLPIPGAKSPEQVEQNASATGVVLNDDLFDAICREFRNDNFYLRHKVHV